MTLPAGKPDAGPPPPVLAVGARTTRTDRGWWKLLLALLVFLFLPTVPQLRAMLPVEESMLLFVPAVAACALVGWWAGGRPWHAALWVALSVYVVWQPLRQPGSFETLVRGWSLLLAGSFGLVCLFGGRQPFFARALTSLGIALGLALVMSMLGPVSFAQASHTVSNELARRNTEAMAMINQWISEHPTEWKQLTQSVPAATEFPAEMDKQLSAFARIGSAAFPALLSLESLFALALAWATHHRLSRSRIGLPLGPLREFRFNDQLVWGLIVGLVIVFLPTLSQLTGVGRNLLVFFGALYAIRGLAVVSWFLSPNRLVTILTVALAVLFWPLLMLLGVAAFGLGLGDTWADWRGRARPTT